MHILDQDILFCVSIKIEQAYKTSDSHFRQMFLSTFDFYQSI